MCRFDDPAKQIEIASRVNSLKVNLVGFLETRVKVHNSLKIVNRHFRQWDFIHNYFFAENGRIWILWKGLSQVIVLEAMDQCITVQVVDGNKDFCCIWIYNLERERRWQHLRSVKERVGTRPWVIGGEFNVLLKPEECSKF